MRKGLFGDRPIHEGTGGIIQLEVPLRPDNAAAVPVSVKTALPQAADRYVKTLFLVVDNNPDPLAVTFHLTPEGGLADLGTNIRIQTHSSVRAVAEMNSGELYMSSKPVKASGGCAAVPMQKEAIASANLGQMLIRVQNDSVRNQPNWAQLIIAHPNRTGLQNDPLKGYPLHAHFIKKLTIRYGDSAILTAETGISISEDPTFRFYYLPRVPGALKVEIEDSRGLIFTKSVEITPK